jgi:hypothetical protein
MSLNVIISKSAIFLSLLNSLAPWNSHFDNRDCLAVQFSQIRLLNTEDKRILNEYTELIGRTKYGEVENCFFHKGNLQETIYIIEKKFAKHDFYLLKELINRFYKDFNKLWDSIIPKLKKRKTQLDNVLSSRLFINSFKKCQYVLDSNVTENIDIYLIPRIKNNSYGTLISEFEDQRLLIMDIFNINKMKNNDRDLRFASLVILHEICHYILADKNNLISKIFGSIKKKYFLSKEQIHDLEEILILTLYPTGVLGVKSNLIKNLKLEGRRNNSSSDYISESAQISLHIMLDHYNKMQKIDFRLVEEIFKLSLTIPKSNFKI